LLHTFCRTPSALALCFALPRTVELSITLTGSGAVTTHTKALTEFTDKQIKQKLSVLHPRAMLLCLFYDSQVRATTLNAVLISSFSACMRSPTRLVYRTEAGTAAACNSCQHGNAGGQIYQLVDGPARQFTSAEGVLRRAAARRVGGLAWPSDVPTK